MSANGRVIGTYVHGLFADDRQRSAWLQRLGAGPATVAYDELVEATLDRLAKHLATFVDLDRLLSASAMTTASSATSAIRSMSARR